MLALYDGPAPDGSNLAKRLADSLGLIVGLSARRFAAGSASYASLPLVEQLPPRNLRARHRWPHWEPLQTRTGKRVLFHGLIYNTAELAWQLDLPDAEPANLYVAALERWGEDADNRIHGNYCAVVHDPADRSARLARSALGAPPLHYFHDGKGFGAASILRTLEPMGLERTLNPRKLIDALYANPVETEDFYLGAWRVGLGAVVTLRPDGHQSRRFYDPARLRLGWRRGDPREMIEETERLLTEACQVMVSGARDPCVTLSGGLDSSNIAARVLRCLPDDQRLKTVTFLPSPELEHEPTYRIVFDERPPVEEFVAMHPRIDPHFTTNEGIEFDHRLDQLFLAMGTGQACITPNFRYHGLLELASNAGCDRMLEGGWGEASFSAYGNWAYGEYLFKGQWRQLRAALKADDLYPRPTWRKLLSRAVIPLLPDRLWRLWMGLTGKAAQSHNLEFAFLKRQALIDHDVVERARASGVSYERNQFGSRRQVVRDQLAREDIEASDYSQAMEQIYEVRMLEVPTYRPLLEYCLSLPSLMFMRDGQIRWLARELGRGNMPEALRTSREVGEENGDWHRRLTPRLAEFRETVRKGRLNPELDYFIDFDALDKALDDWPDQPTMAEEVFFPLGFGLPRAIAMIRYVNYMTGRNESA